MIIKATKEAKAEFSENLFYKFVSAVILTANSSWWGNGQCGRSITKETKKKKNKINK